MFRSYLNRKSVVGFAVVVLIFLFGIVGPFFVQDPLAIDNLGMAPPSPQHLLGTTQTGQDVFAQLAYATRGSLIIGLLVGAMALFLSFLFGVLGGYAGGWLDEVFSLFTNVVLILPGLPLMIVIGSYVQQKGILLISLVLAVTSWAANARVLRAQTLSLRNRDYVLAARVAGENPVRIITVEILPNLLPVMSSSFVFAMIWAILGEAGLAFIGLGVVGTQTWGSMLAYAQNGQALTLGGWWWFGPPGAMIALLGMGLALINFAIDEVINPRLRTQHLHRAKKLIKSSRREVVA
ncbi:ABC transporter permease [Microlunatus parietis]|uniref:Peptide/nickel transport system permease protein n=1 Tax=Microlunatus parietis TaxID=682979 RepID=A0A7Y9I9G6_9ACTN|nr:ABC transporter permease [Microlunatus parietis]NYE72725.1 peptide/nickel transport system permease protein [Microlunatus parietis]